MTNETPDQEFANKATPPVSDRLAHSIDETAQLVGFGRTKIYEEISAGRLVAHKSGGRTIILHPNLLAWLASLPRMGAAAIWLGIMFMGLVIGISVA